LAKKSIVPEFIQGNIRPKAIAEETDRLLADPKRIKEMTDAFLEVKHLLGDSGASRKAAQAMTEYLDSTS